MKNKIDVLDHGYIRLVDHMGGDLSVVRSARVSFNADWRSGVQKGSDAALIRYLWNNRHGTPFEAVTVTFEVQAPLFVFRQWHRHRIASINEISARYTELPNVFFIPDLDTIGTQSTNNKQGRDMGAAEDVARAARLEAYRAGLRVMYRQAYEAYERSLALGVPREIARASLPMAIYSRMFYTANLRSLFHFLELRLDSHAQYEIRVYAEALLELIKPIAPVCTQAFLESR